MRVIHKNIFTTFLITLLLNSSLASQELSPLQWPTITLPYGLRLQKKQEDFVSSLPDVSLDPLLLVKNICDTSDLFYTAVESLKNLAKTCKFFHEVIHNPIVIKACIKRLAHRHKINTLDVAIELNMPILRTPPIRMWLWKLFLDKELLQAVRQNKTENVATALLLGASPDARIDGETALASAISKHHRKVMKILLDHGADVDYVDQIGNTPLMVAVRACNQCAVGLLVNRGADVQARDKQGDTAVTMAATKGFRKMRSVMLKGPQTRPLQQKSFLLNMQEQATYIQSKDSEKVSPFCLLSCELHVQIMLHLMHVEPNYYRGVKDIHALMRTCKWFYRLFNTEGFVWPFISQLAVVGKTDHLKIAVALNIPRLRNREIQSKLIQTKLNRDALEGAERKTDRKLKTALLLGADPNCRSVRLPNFTPLLVATKAASVHNMRILLKEIQKYGGS